jgi:riboflavin synthase
MFTGLISAIGEIVAIESLGDSLSHGKRLTLQTPEGYLDDVHLGDSIALNGACMTVTGLVAANHQFQIEISTESLSKTAALTQLGKVNLEKALRATDRLGGHLVSGHVDGLGEVVLHEPVGESWLLRLRIPAHLSKYLAFKGSITVNGVSLTVNRVQDKQDQSCLIDINLIAHTHVHTTLSGLRVQDKVNLEVDLIARYCERMLSTSKVGSHSL